MVRHCLCRGSSGRSYSASDVASYVDKDHRTAVFAAVALGLLSVLGLLLLLAGLRERLAEGDSLTATVFWSASVLSVAGFAIGWVTVLTVPISRAYGGTSVVVIDPVLTYTITEIGWVIMFAVGGTFLGVALDHGGDRSGPCIPCLAALVHTRGRRDRARITRLDPVFRAPYLGGHRQPLAARLRTLQYQPVQPDRLAHQCLCDSAGQTDEDLPGPIGWLTVPQARTH